jgi:hypothetical protein
VSVRQKATAKILRKNIRGRGPVAQWIALPHMSETQYGNELGHKFEILIRDLLFQAIKKKPTLDSRVELEISQKWSNRIYFRSS